MQGRRYEAEFTERNPLALPICGPSDWELYKQVVSDSYIKSLEICMSKGDPTSEDEREYDGIDAEEEHGPQDEIVLLSQPPEIVWPSQPPEMVKELGHRVEDISPFLHGPTAIPFLEISASSRGHFEEDNVRFDVAVMNNNLDKDMINARGQSGSDLDDDWISSDEELGRHSYMSAQPTEHCFDDVRGVDNAVCNDGPPRIMVDKIGRTEDKKPKLVKNSIFSTFHKLEACITDYLVKHYRPHRIVHSDINKRYTVECKVPRYSWRVYARLTKEKQWIISNMGPEHTCENSQASDKHSQLTVN